MTIAVIALAIAVGVMTAALVSSFIWARREMEARFAAQEDKLSVEKKAADLEDDRDRVLVFQVKAEAERDQALHAVAVHKADALAAREELSKHVREKLVTGTDDDVAAEVDRLLGARKVQAVPIVPAPPAGGGDGHT